MILNKQKKMKRAQKTVADVTVYVVNHNYGRFLNQCLESIFSQTLKPKQILLIDDGSIDAETRDVISKYRSNPLVDIIENSKKGLTACCNIAINKAVGSFLIRLDADDFLDPKAIEILYSKIIENQEIVLVSPDYWLVNDLGKKIGAYERLSFEQEVTVFDRPSHGACTLIRKEFLLEIGGYDENIPKQDGVDVWLSAITSNKLVANVREKLFYYRQHEKSLSFDKRNLLSFREKVFSKHCAKASKLDDYASCLIPLKDRDSPKALAPLDVLNGNNLLGRSIEQALSSDFVRDVCVITSSDEARNMVKKIYGGKVKTLFRPTSLEIDSVTLEDSFSYFEFDEFTLQSETIMTLNVDYPFRKTEILNLAIQTYLLIASDTVTTVFEDNEKFFQKTLRGLQRVGNHDTRRSERHDFFRKAGGVFVANKNYLSGKIGKAFARSALVEIDELSALNINDYEFVIGLQSDVLRES